MNGPATHGLRLPLKALARLLDYPDQALVDHLDAAAGALRAAPGLDAAERASVEDFLGWMRAQPLLDLQAAYVETFDRGRQASLYLFEHVYGESRRRGPAMLELAGAYREHGLEIDGRELPDYLPLFLEFCGELPDAAAHAWIEEVGHIVQQVHVRLARRESRYAVPLRALLRLARLDPTPEDLVRAAAGEARDDTPAALDRVWMEAPVTFGPEAPPAGGGTTTPGAQPVQWTDRRTAQRSGRK